MRQEESCVASRMPCIAPALQLDAVKMLLCDKQQIVPSTGAQGAWPLSARMESEAYDPSLGAHSRSA